MGDWWNPFDDENKNTGHAQTAPINEEAYEYGGKYGGADEAANRYRQQAEQAQGREAAQANYTAANHLGILPGMQARGDMNTVGQAQLARALGKVPSIAQMQADRQMGQATAAQASAAASARGPAAMALAQQGAANNTANAHGAISGQAQINAATERMQAEQAAAGTFGNMGALDAQRTAQLAQMSQYQATNQMQQRELNDRYDIAKSGHEIGVRGMQLGGAQNREAQYSSNYLGAAGINAGVAGQNAAINQNNAWQAIGGIAGAGMAGAGSAAGAVTGKADGGPVKAGRTYVTGERGPELVIDLDKPEEEVIDLDAPAQPYIVGEKGPELHTPPRDGVVIPAEVTGPLLSGVIDLDDTSMRDGSSDPRTYNMDKSFHRDSKADQKRVKKGVEDKAGHDADAMIAAFQAALERGPAVASRPPQEDTGKLARRADGGPLAQGQTSVVGERGPEVFVPFMSTMGTGGPDVEEQRLASSQAETQGRQAQAAYGQAQDYVDPYQRDVNEVRTLRAISPGLVDDDDMRRERVGKAKMRLRGQSNGETKEPAEKADPAEKQAVAEGKANPKSAALGRVLGSVGNSAASMMRPRDISYRGHAAISGPNLIPVSAPGRADGGAITGGNPYTVGERGPELVMPTLPRFGTSGTQGMGAAAPTFDVMSGAGMDAMGSLKKHSDFATQFQRNPTIAGARADGGEVERDEKYMVGERGPEMVVPLTAAQEAAKQVAIEEMRDRMAKEAQAPGAAEARANNDRSIAGPQVRQLTEFKRDTNARKDIADQMAGTASNVLTPGVVPLSALLARVLGKR